MPSTILIVDDDVVQQRILRYILKSEGYDLVEAVNGLKALDVFLETQPDMVLLDAMMPDLDGFSACQEIRNLPGGESVPILIVTTLQDDESINRVFEVGATDYIAKPINAVLLRRRMRRLLQSREAEIALHHREHYYRSLIENAPDIISILNADGTIRYQSPAAYRILGYQESEMIGKNAFSFVHPDDLPGVVAQVQQSLGPQKTAAPIQYRYQCRNGTWRVFESQGQIRLDDPVVAGIIFNTRDVTERANTQKALERSEKYYRSLIEQASDLIAVINADAKFRYVSPSFCRAFGYSEAELIGRTAFDFTHPEDLPRVSRRFSEAVESGQSPEKSSVYRSRFKDGNWHYLETSSLNLLEEPAVRGYVLVSRDVTERKLTEAALQVSQAKNRALVEALPDGVAWMRADGMVIDYRPNPQFTTPVFSTSVIGRNIQEFLPPPFVEIAFQSINQALQTNEVQVVEFSFPSGDRHYDFEARTVAVGLEETITLFRDITVQKTAERLINAHVEELAEANLKLQEMDRVKANFTAMLAHDLRSPLAVVSAALEMFEHKDLMKPEDLDVLFQTAKQSLEKVLTLIDDLLEVFRSESQGFKLSCIPIQPKNLLGECAEEAMVAASRRQIGFQVEIAPDLPGISADPKQLARVFSNLLSNAIKFTAPRGTIRFEACSVEMEGEASGTCWLNVKISDTGQGIPAPALPFIFDPYQQAQADSKRLGVGLGLAIVKRIVAAHGGTISVSSEVGVGSCFMVLLPTL